MKPFQSITVYVEYRYDAGGDRPRDRLLRARVAQTVTHTGGVCRALGEELIAPRKLTDRDMPTVHSLCLAQLRGLAQRVTFEYDALLGLEPEQYPIGEVA